MNNSSEPYIPETSQEIFWIAVSFFAGSYEVQCRIISQLTVDDRYSQASRDVKEPIISTLVFCYINYLSMEPFDGDILQLVFELYGLFNAIQSHSYLEQKGGLDVSTIMNITAMKEGDGWRNRLWMLVRRLTRQMLDEWGIGYYPFDKVGMIAYDEWVW